jgi:glycosyltransferase involved in cell wall biosynthesis
MAPRASVIVPARDAAATLPRTLAALEGADVIVVDDGSADATARIAEDAGATVVRQGREGPAKARNAGVANTDAPLLAFTDADCVPEPGWLACGVAALEQADLVQGAVLPEREPGPFDRTITVRSAHGLFETASLFVTRDLFERLGGFERWLVPPDGKELGEDVLFGWQARRAGARVAFEPDAVVRHAVFPRSPHAYVAERARLAAYPALARRIPELRSAALHRRWFLSKRSLAFDAALAAALTGRRALALPYALTLARDIRAYGGRVAATRAVADAASAGALARGSLRHRTAVL